MAKAINWAEEFYDEIIDEDSESLKIALRIGNLYYDNAYYSDKEIVDIRVNHKIVRQACIVGDLNLLKIKNLSEDDFKKYKSKLNDKENVIKFLSHHYNQDITEDTHVTVITYKNLPYELKENINDTYLQT